MFSHPSSDSILTLPNIKENVHRNYENFASALRQDFDERQIEQMYKVKEESLEIDQRMCDTNVELYL